MTSENRIQDTGPEQPSVDPAIAQLLGEVTAIKNQQGYITRQLARLEPGQTIPATLQRDITALHQRLESMEMQSMTDEEKIEYLDKLRKTPAEAAPAPQPMSQAALEANVAACYAGPVMEQIRDICEAGGINLTESLLDALNQIPMEINEYTGEVLPLSYMLKATKLLKAAEKQQHASKPPTPAEEAGAALGNGNRASGGRGAAGITWEEARRQAARGELSDEALAALLASG